MLDGEDISILNITAIDSYGREVPDADNFIVFKIKSNGKIIGIGNGDPSSHEPDEILTGDYYRKLFMGKCQVIVQGTKDAGEIEIEAESRGLKAVKCKLTTVAATIRLYNNYQYDHLPKEYNKASNKAIYLLQSED